jgi:hypothetical protein
MVSNPQTPPGVFAHRDLIGLVAANVDHIEPETRGLTQGAEKWTTVVLGQWPGTMIPDPAASAFEKSFPVQLDAPLLSRP